jgi:hypothetical protein
VGRQVSVLELVRSYNMFKTHTRGKYWDIFHDSMIFPAQCNINTRVYGDYPALTLAGIGGIWGLFSSFSIEMQM